MVNRKIELLSPAGSFEALKAAVCAGCDAVYVGMNEFSARAYATNFDDNTIDEAIKYVHAFNVKIYVAINIQIYDKEISRCVSLILSLWNRGVDGFIISNIGLASYLFNNYPEIELHASTQATGQNILSAQFFSNLGFKRMVAPREISYSDLKILTEKSNIEIELFIHGALCVCHSGQCLMSSMIGGRSGNRGMCAQPCRMKYEGKNEYPLSLKDMNLANHIEEIINLNIASLKIEGRMKSPEYVYVVTSIYRRLLDEKRNANKDEIDTLNNIFSRSGSTDGYFVNNINSNMLGYRTIENKQNTKDSSNIVIEEKKLPISFACQLRESEKSKIKIRYDNFEKHIEMSLEGDVISKAITHPLTKEDIIKQLSKLGNTCFYLNNIDIDMDENISLPLSSLNNLRRSAIESLLEKLKNVRTVDTNVNFSNEHYSNKGYSNIKIAYFSNAFSITKKSLDYFDIIFVDIFEYKKAKKMIDNSKLGFMYPPVILDSEVYEIEYLAKEIRNDGCKYALITNTCQISNAFENGFEIILSHRLNVYNSLDVEYYSSLGIKNIIASPEIGLEKSKYIGNEETNIIVISYGRIPLMTLEKCVIHDVLGIKKQNKECTYCQDGKFVNLVDSTKANFLVYGYGNKYRHRNVLFNSVPIWMGDKMNQIQNSCLSSVFYFTNEEPYEVDSIISNYMNGKEFKDRFRRI